jgi:pSer/pThr/pTyr-binding forkhead associated (FHA) protein
MKCKNCKASIPDDSETCPECGVYVNQLKIDENSGIFNTGTDEITEVIKDDVDNNGVFLVLENGTKYNLPEGREITIGRKDVGSSPDIDLGPYDKGPYISRNQGTFILQDGDLFFTDKSKNGTTLNGREMEKNARTKLKNKDELQFGKIRGVIESL